MAPPFTTLYDNSVINSFKKTKRFSSILAVSACVSQYNNVYYQFLCTFAIARYTYIWY